MDEPQVDVIGRVPNPSWWRGRALLHLAPVSAPGLQTSLIESMAAGLPFVTTPLGAEGLRLGSLAERLVSTSVADMAEQARKLLSDRALWTDVQDWLIDLAEGYFSPSSLRRVVDDALLSCGLAPVMSRRLL
jgi:glycosyltransferase involved in cell wall biosynthesis